MKTKLSVNLNKVALLRNQRDVGYPSVVSVARSVIQAGADGITVHPRPDQRHTRLSDVRELRALISAEFCDAAEFNVEGYPTDEFLSLVDDVLPTQVTLVPDAPDQKTSDHGWDLSGDDRWLETVVAGLRESGIRVSLFLEPDPDAVRRAASTGAQRIELYTEHYARAFSTSERERILDRYVAAAEVAVECGLGVNAGHDLTLENLPDFKRRVPTLAEVSIGHAITADALLIGFPAATRAYLEAME